MTGEQIREYRMRLGLSQTDIGNVLELHRAYISIAEGGLLRLHEEDEQRLVAFFRKELSEVQNMSLPEAGQ